MSVMLYIWLGLFIVTLAVEIAVPGLVSLWFSVGSLASLIMSIFLGDTLIWLQILVFVVVSVLSIFALRPLFMKNKVPETKTNSESLIGEVGFTTKDINPYEVGSVKMKGLEWSAELLSADMDPIKSGEKVIVKEIKGNKLIVELFKEEA